MQVNGFRAVKSMQLPDLWVAGTERSTPIMQIKSWYPSEQSDVEITFLVRQKNAPPNAMASLKEIFLLPPHKFMDGGTELRSVLPALGNIADNQWTNRNTGREGPGFRMHSCETTKVNQHIVLMVKGSFIDPETKKPITEYCGLFIEIPKEKNQLEELFLQVPTSYGYMTFERYLKTFLQSLQSIVWTN